VLHAFVPQMYGTQVPGVGVAQLPAPSQYAAGVIVVPLHEAEPHCTLVVACWQLPAPSQAPVLPQGGLAAHWLEVVPAATAAQVPCPLMLQAWQLGQLLLPQHTLLTQLPLIHWLPIAQLRPFFFRAQFPLWQVNGETQSLSAVQAVLQAVVPQT